MTISFSLIIKILALKPPIMQNNPHTQHHMHK